MHIGRQVLITVLAAGLVSAVATAAVGEVDLSGTWAMTIQGKTPPGKNYSSLTFEPSGDALVVVMQGKGGELRNAATLEGDQLRFEHAPPGKKSSLVVFSGRVRGDLMGGEVDMGKRGTSTWQATREGDGVFDLTGTWTFFQKGLPKDYANLTKLRFHQEGPHPGRHLHHRRRPRRCARAISTARRWGSSTPARPGAGPDRSAKYAGRVSGDLMSGEVDLGEGGKSTWRATRDDE